MAQRLSRPERARTPWQRQIVAPRPHARSRKPARVVVAWSCPTDTEGGRCLAPVNLELESSSTAGRTWRCRELGDSSWVEAISAARCDEVVLTARLGNDERARHLVLDLAELLTRRLAATKPHVRVRFLPSVEEEADAADVRSA